MPRLREDAARIPAILVTANILLAAAWLIVHARLPRHAPTLLEWSHAWLGLSVFTLGLVSIPITIVVAHTVSTRTRSTQWLVIHGFLMLVVASSSRFV